MRLQLRRFASVVALLSFLFVAKFQAQQITAPPLPQDSGPTGLLQALQHLRNTGRLLHTTAHPDDEDGGMLTFMSRGQGTHVMQLTLNRGEGGQNRTGSGLFDELGMLRTLELLAADRNYGVEQRFTRVADFGFSKSPEETFEKWGGHDIALSDMVRIIRTFRPDVIVSRFQGAPRDGHGHHQAAGILSREAFRAAADPKRFPEQIEEGLLPWQAKKLYMAVREGEDYTVMFDAGVESSLLGMSYQAYAMQGLKHQLSQGAGQWRFGGGPAPRRYKLIDSVLPNTVGADGHERDFFDGIDTSVGGLARRLGAEAVREKNLPPLFQQLQAKLDEAANAAAKDPRSAARPLSECLNLLGQIRSEMKAPGFSKLVMEDITSHLPAWNDVEHAIALAQGVSVEAKMIVPAGPSAELIVPGEHFSVVVKLHGSGASRVVKAELMAPEGWGINALPVDEKSPLERRFEVSVPQNAQYTKPYYHRENADTDTIYKIDDPQYLTLPLVPPPLRAQVRYEMDGVTATEQDFVRADSALEGGTRAVPLAIAPGVSVLFDHQSCIIRKGQLQPVEITVRVRSNAPEIRDGTLSLLPNMAWRVEPASQPVEMKGKGTERSFKFFLFPDANTELKFDVRAKLTVSGHDYFEGFSTVTREDLATGYYYQPATEHVSVIDVKLPQNYSVGYVMGAGDDIPTVLKQVGLGLKMISPEELRGEDLHKYNAIVLGIRAYDANDDVKKNNARLLEFVEKGGTLVVQYNASVQEFNDGKYTPYPATLSRDRVSDERAPVEILEPHDLVLNEPNDIVPGDFDGWVQERGLYFMSNWGGRFSPLLRSGDPGEPPKDGGLMRAWYGKGTYIYTGYSFFRQLPNGVPGALRLFVNLLSAHQ